MAGERSLPRLGYKDTGFHLGCLSHSVSAGSHWGKLVAMSWGSLKERVMCGRLSPANNHVSELGSKYSHHTTTPSPIPSQAFRWNYSLSQHLDNSWETLNQRHSGKLHLDSWPTETEIRNVCSFKLPSFGVICYAAIKQCLLLSKFA